MSSVDAPATPRSAPRVVSDHQVAVDSFEPGRTTREMTSARARSRWRLAGPSSAGSPSFTAIACAAATCPCGSDPVMVTAWAAGTSRSPFKVASIAVTASAGSADRFASVSCRTLPPSR